MRYNYRSLVLLGTLIITTVSSFAQKKDEETRYKEEFQSLRKEIWGWKNPEFAVRSIPAEFNNSSKVVIARHMEINADSKADSKRGIWAVSIYRDYYLTEITREVIKLNDKVAVDEYSEFTFTKMEYTSFFYSAKNIYLGVRVIKPDGSIKETTTEDIVVTSDKSSKKEAKIAIPDLQPGDIIDYFIAKKQALDNYVGTVSNYSFLLVDEAPVMHYSVHVAVGKRFATEYRCYNGAPDFKRQAPASNENFFDLVVRNISADAESGLWTSPYRQLPIIRMNILVAVKNPISRKYNLRDAGEVYANPPADEFIEDEKINIRDIKTVQMTTRTGSAGGISADLPGNVSKYYFQLLKNKDKIPFDSLTAELYYLFRYARFLHVPAYSDIDATVSTNKRAINPNSNLFDFGAMLRGKDIECDMVLVTSRKGPHFKEILSSGDISWMLLARGDKEKLFGMTDVFSPAFYIPENFENTRQAMTMRIVGKTKNYDEGTVNIPGSSSLENSRTEILIVTPSVNGTDLQISRKCILKGHYKQDVQKNLILFEDYCNAERKSFGEAKTIIEELEDMKNKKSYAPELKAAFNKERNSQKDAFTTEIKEWFDQTITDLTDYKIENLGVRHNNPDFVYSSKFAMNGLIKKAGNNMIIEVGKLQGTPLTIRTDQRKRKRDIYMPFARSLQTNITLQIPEGYTIEGVNELNKKVENDVGHFIADATSDGKTVAIKLKKSYNHAFEPAANWDKLLAFIDAANEWINAKLLLKKK